MTVDGLALPDHGAPGEAPAATRSTLVVAWQNPESRLISPVGLLDHRGSTYSFRYLRGAPLVDGFQPFLSFPRWDDLYTSPRLFALFSQRIMSPRRPDFADYLHQLDLSADSTPWEQLARSEGRRTGDTVQLFPVPAVSPDGRTRCLFLVHGIRHVLGEAPLPLEPGDDLVLVTEPDNDHSERAILVSTTTGQRIGYVPDLLLDHVEAVRGQGAANVQVEHVNGPEAPPHLRVLALLEGRVPPNYQPMTGPGWRTFV